MINVRLCVIVLLYVFIPLSVIMTISQGHSNISPDVIVCG